MHKCVKGKQTFRVLRFTDASDASHRNPLQRAACHGCDKYSCAFKLFMGISGLHPSAHAETLVYSKARLEHLYQYPVQDENKTKIQIVLVLAKRGESFAEKLNPCIDIR